MLIKKIKFTDFKGVEREQDYYFHMSKPEVVKWMTTNGNYTLDAVLGRLIKTENVKDLVGEFEFLIKASYGEISLDGISFIKSKEATDKFVQSPAYDELFMELVGDAKKAAAFFNGILPDDLSQDIEKAMKDNPDTLPDVLKDYVGDLKSEETKPADVVQMPTQPTT